jgi:hypothetical protein
MVSRLGLKVRRRVDEEDSDFEPDDDEPGAYSLLVTGVDGDHLQATPVTQWNAMEVRKVDKGENERHAAWVIKPGDRICAVNGAQGDKAMFHALVSAASLNDPKPVSLCLEREKSDILYPVDPYSDAMAAPSEFRARSSRSRSDPAVPALSVELNAPGAQNQARRKSDPAFLDQAPLDTRCSLSRLSTREPSRSSSAIGSDRDARSSLPSSRASSRMSSNTDTRSRGSLRAAAPPSPFIQLGKAVVLNQRA